MAGASGYVVINNVNYVVTYNAKTGTYVVTHPASVSGIQTLAQWINSINDSNTAATIYTTLVSAVVSTIQTYTNVSSAKAFLLSMSQVLETLYGEGVAKFGQVEFEQSVSALTPKIIPALTRATKAIVAGAAGDLANVALGAIAVVSSRPG